MPQSREPKIQKLTPEEEHLSEEGVVGEGEGEAVEAVVEAGMSLARQEMPAQRRLDGGKRPIKEARRTTIDEIKERRKWPEVGFPDEALTSIDCILSARHEIALLHGYLSIYAGFPKALLSIPLSLEKSASPLRISRSYTSVTSARKRRFTPEYRS